jgi:hypothetical protein
MKGILSSESNDIQSYKDTNKEHITEHRRKDALVVAFLPSSLPMLHPLFLIRGPALMPLARTSTDTSEHIHLRPLEPPRRHLVLEQQIQLSVTPVLALRQTEEAVKRAETRGCAPEEPGLGTPVPCERREHPGDDDTTDDVHDLCGTKRQRMMWKEEGEINVVPDTQSSKAQCSSASTVYSIPPR